MVAQCRAADAADSCATLPLTMAGPGSTIPVRRKAGGEGMTWLRIRVHVLAGALLLGASLLASAALAFDEAAGAATQSSERPPDTPDSEWTDEWIDAHADHRGVDRVTAIRRMHIEDAAGEFEALVRDSYPDLFAGLWIDKREPLVHLALAGADAATVEQIRRLFLS